MRKAGILIVIPMLVLLVPLFWIIGTATSIAIQEGLAMKTTILVIIVMLGLMIPLMWFIGTLISMVYFYLHRVKATREERTVAFNPQLGLTMADGGSSIDKEGKEQAVAKQVGTPAMSLVSSGKGMLGSDGDKS